MAVTNSGTAVITLPTDTDILITRNFAAPKHLVYKAWTTPEYIRRWWSGGIIEVKSVEVDLRVGGTWRYAMAAGEGSVGPLVESRSTPSGVTVQVYRPTGRPQYATATSAYEDAPNPAPAGRKRRES